METCVNAKPGSSKFHDHKCKLCDLCYTCHECPDIVMQPLQRRIKKTNKVKRNYRKKTIVHDEYFLDDEEIRNFIVVDKQPRYIIVGPNNEIQEKSSNDDQFKQTDEFIVESDLSSSPTLNECPICDKTFKSKRDLDIHNIYHSNEDEHNCDICFTSFKYSYELIKHKINHKFPCFCCPFCKQEFSTEEKCKLHTRKHTKEKLFTCDICAKSFLENQTLKNHIMIHTDERPFACDKCLRSFRSKFYLTRHKWIHEGIKPFVCQVCEKTFRHKCNLKTHLKKHLNLSYNEDD